MYIALRMLLFIRLFLKLLHAFGDGYNSPLAPDVLDSFQTQALQTAAFDADSPFALTPVHKPGAALPAKVAIELPPAHGLPAITTNMQRVYPENLHVISIKYSPHSILYYSTPCETNDAHTDGESCENGRYAEGRGRLLLALEAVADVEVLRHGLRGSESDRAALAGSFHYFGFEIQSVTLSLLSVLV